MTPTREQVIEWAREADIIDFRDEADDPHVKQMVDMLMHAVNKAHTAGRDQGLREAAERARGDGIPGISADDDEIVADWLDAAAIEQLRAK